jgi:hypothetical protein
MSHWAELDNNNKVIRITVGDNNDPNGDEGYQWIIDNLGGTWVKTSYNHNIRKNYAIIDGTYDAERDAFIAPKPFASWILNEETCRWEAPTPIPTEEGNWVWVESDLEWQIIIPQ